MSRINLPVGDMPDTARLFSMNPAMGKALAGLSQAIYSQTTIDLRVREAVRMRIAHINQCTLCVGFRFPQQAAEFAAAGIDEAFYAAIPDWRNSALFSEREKIAIDYAEKFAQDHLSLDENFFADLHKHFSDEEIFTLTTIIAGLIANGRILQVLQVAQGSCGI
jgi:alkylhydroperoxidase family enzyme